MADKFKMLGSFEQFVLMSVLRLEPNAYGMVIRQDIQTQTGRQISLAAVYITLDRLETKGYVSSQLGNPTPERGGRAKRFFKVETAGKQALKEALASINKMIG